MILEAAIWLYILQNDESAYLDRLKGRGESVRASVRDAVGAEAPIYTIGVN